MGGCEECGEAMVEEDDAGTGIGRSAGRRGILWDGSGDARRVVAMPDAWLAGLGAAPRSSNSQGWLASKLWQPAALSLFLSPRAGRRGVEKREAVMVAGWWDAALAITAAPPCGYVVQ